jgi:hypothetical protein
MPSEREGESTDSSHTSSGEKEAMQRHYEHYKALAEAGTLSPEDELQWKLAQQRKASGLID